MLAIVIVGFMVLVLPGDKERSVGTVLQLGLLVFWGFFLLGKPYWSATRQYRKLQYLREPMTYCFAEQGIRLEGPSFKGEIVWDLVHRVKETKSGFLIYQGPQLAWILPKRFFPDANEIPRWKKFVAQHVSDAKRFSPPGVVGSLF